MEMDIRLSSGTVKEQGMEETEKNEQHPNERGAGNTGWPTKMEIRH